MQNDLIYSYTDNKIADSIIFPVTDVIGFNFLLPTNSITPIHLHAIKNIKKVDDDQYLLLFADKHDTLQLQCLMTSVLRESDIYTFQVTDMNNIYAGCLVVNSSFISWLNNLAVSILYCTPNSIIFNPSYYALYRDIQDLRLSYQGQKINKIVFNNMYTPDNDDAEDHILQFNVPEKFVEKTVSYATQLDLGNGCTLSGKSISLIPTNSALGRITFDGKVLKFTDDGKV